MQILGGILGAAMSKYLTAGTDDSTPGCFVPSHGVTNDQVKSGQKAAERPPRRASPLRSPTSG